MRRARSELDAAPRSNRDWRELADEAFRQRDTALLQRDNALANLGAVNARLATLRVAAGLVLARWESGDLAEAVRGLDAAVRS